MPKPIWKGSAGIVEGGVTFTIAGGGAVRRPERPRITNDEDERIAAREKTEALAKAAAAVTEVTEVTEVAGARPAADPATSSECSTELESPWQTSTPQ